MKRAIAFATVAFASLLMFAPTAQGGSATPEDGESAVHGRSKKNSSCKDSCFHAEATCRGKRGTCMAARQSCVRGCR